MLPASSRPVTSDLWSIGVSNQCFKTLKHTLGKKKNQSI